MINAIKQFPKKFYYEYINIVWVRFVFIVLAVIFGIFLTDCYFESIKSYLLDNIDSLQSDSRVISYLYTAILTLPLLLVLWFFRTKDTREQILKTEQQIDTTQFHKAVDLALATTNEEDKKIIDIEKRGAGVTMLAELYQTGNDNLRKSIDNITTDLDLMGIKIPNINLSGMNFNYANLRNANLQGAYLQGADLQGTNLLNAKLKDVNLQDAYLKDANLQGTELEKANLQDANLQDANFINTKLQGVSLQGANLQNINLQGTDLQNVDLQGIDLHGVNLRNAKLQGAKLQNANLRDTNLINAKLQGSNLKGTDLQNSDLQGANLQDNILQKTNLQSVDLKDAKYNKNTKFPDGFDPKEKGMIEIK